MSGNASALSASSATSTTATATSRAHRAQQPGQPEAGIGCGRVDGQPGRVGGGGRASTAASSSGVAGHAAIPQARAATRCPPAACWPIRCARRRGPVGAGHSSGVTPPAGRRPPDPRPSPIASSSRNSAHRADELGVGADVDDPAVVEDGDAVGQRQRRAPVGDEQRGAALRERAQRVVDRLLGGGVDRGGGVVEHQDPRVGEHRPGQRDPLPLAAGEREPALADDRVVAVGQALDELVRLRGPRGGPHLLVGGVGAAVGDVGADGVGEQEASSNTTPSSRRRSTSRSDGSGTPPRRSSPSCGS